MGAGGIKSPSETMASGIAQKKGGAPEGGRRSNHMDNVVQARSAGNGSVAHMAEFHTQSQNKKLGIWLDSLVAKAKDKPIVQMVQLTPEMAAMLLDRNPDNRKLSVNAVENYALEISGGRWLFNGEPIIVSDTGLLNDGQHRCAAVVEAGKPIDVILIVGVKRDTRTTLDQGKTRTIGDYLAMEGNSYANVLGSAAGYVWLHRMRGQLVTGGRGSKFKKASKTEVMEVVHENPGLKKSVLLVQERGADAAGGKSILAFVHFTLSALDREDADHFIYSLMSGAGLKAGNPILYARNRLINERGRLNANDKAELLFKTWNAWRKGATVSRLLLTGGVLPVLER